MPKDDFDYISKKKKCQCKVYYRRARSRSDKHLEQIAKILEKIYLNM